MLADAQVLLFVFAVRRLIGVRLPVFRTLAAGWPCPRARAGPCPDNPSSLPPALWL
jgi:hypothetical protein